MKCILISLLILVCGFFASNILALKCVTPDGLQVDEVRKVIKKCMKKVTSDDDSNMLKNYSEYENFDDQQSDREGGNDSTRYRDNNRMSNYNNNYNPSRPRLRLDHNYDYPQTGGNYRRNDRHGHDPSQYNPYQFTYGDNNNYNNNQRGNFHYNSNGQNKNNNDNSTATVVDIDKHERDRSCILQCFFQELKMTNDEGFPDRNRLINVLTKQLRDKELRDFYIDSIQECKRMISLDEPKVQRDSCLYSKNLIICLTERAKMNCVDWNAETVLF